MIFLKEKKGKKGKLKLAPTKADKLAVHNGENPGSYDGGSTNLLDTMFKCTIMITNITIITIPLTMIVIMNTMR